MTGATVAKQLTGRDSTRLCLARERLLSMGWTRAELANMPASQILTLAGEGWFRRLQNLWMFLEFCDPCPTDRQIAEQQLAYMIGRRP